MTESVLQVAASGTESPEPAQALAAARRSLEDLCPVWQ